MASPVSLPRVLNELNLVKQEVQSNKQLLITILSTLDTLKDDSLKSNSSLFTKIEELENCVDVVHTAVNDIIGPQEVSEISESAIATYDAPTVNSGEIRNIPNRNIAEVTSVQVFEENDMIKVEEVKEEALYEEDQEYREEYQEYDEELDQTNDLSLQNYPSKKAKKCYKRQSPDFESNADFLSEAESPIAFKRQRSQIKKCRDGCPNCEKLPCRECKNCLSKKRCQFKVCIEFKKLRQEEMRVNSICPKCKKSFSGRPNLLRHTKLNNCVREHFKYNDYMVKCFEEGCSNSIYPNYNSYTEHRIISGHKKWKYKCDICSKFIISKSIKAHIESHAN